MSELVEYLRATEQHMLSWSAWVKYYREHPLGTDCGSWPRDAFECNIIETFIEAADRIEELEEQWGWKRGVGEAVRSNGWRKLAALRELASAEAADRIEELERALQGALELVDDLRGYAAQSWNWKYGEVWDRDREQARAILEKKS